MPSRASSSARSLNSSPAWPLTQSHWTSWRAAAASSRRHRSSFLTGFLSAVRQPLRFHRSSQPVTPPRRYCESVCRRHRAGAGQRFERLDGGRELHAIVGGRAARRPSAPSRGRRSAARRPSRRGRGCPSRRRRSRSKLVGSPHQSVIGGRASRAGGSAACRDIRVDSSARPSRPGGTFSQSTSRVSMKRSAAPRARIGSAAISDVLQRTHALVGRDHGPALGDVEGVVRLEAPGAETDRQIVGERVVAGEVEIDEARQPLAEEEDVVVEEIGVDDAARQAGRPVRLRERRARLRFPRAGAARLRPPDFPPRGTGAASRRSTAHWRAASRNPRPPGACAPSASPTCAQ